MTLNLPYDFNPALSPEQRLASIKVIKSINNATYNDEYVNNKIINKDGTEQLIIDINSNIDNREKKDTNQRKQQGKPIGVVPRRCVVTGGTGFVGIRIVEMLIERGAEEVISFDIVPKEKVIGSWNHPRIKYIVGDICDYEQVKDVIKGTDCVWHLAAAVGPFHPRWLFEKVNHQGTVNVVNACIETGVKKLVYSSSPSTRFKGGLFHRPCIDGLTEAQMPKIPLDHYLQGYAEGKANGEMYVTKRTKEGKLLSVAVAPHQVYGPRDNLFLPNILEAAGTGKLHIFGNGLNRICFSHVDNYAHAMIIAERQLYPESPVLGKFYVATDGATHTEPDAYCIFWKVVDQGVRGMGFTSLWQKFKFPFFFIYSVALVAEFFAWIMDTTFKLNVFNVFVLTMHRWFIITAVTKDFNYKPIISFRDGGWQDTIEWFKENWLPVFMANKEVAAKSMVGISSRSQAKIDMQTQRTKRN